jgi:hypothetical protein
MLRLASVLTAQQTVKAARLTLTPEHPDYRSTPAPGR